jgi:glucose/arabinose dehydrogenase
MQFSSSKALIAQALLRPTAWAGRRLLLAFLMLLEAGVGFVLTTVVALGFFVALVFGFLLGAENFPTWFMLGIALGSLLLLGTITISRAFSRGVTSRKATKRSRSGRSKSSFNFYIEPLEPRLLLSTVSLESAFVLVDESDNVATINVLRQEGSAGQVSVVYRTLDAGAASGSDYQSQQGTLSFEDGQTLASVAVPITNDGVAESNESVRFYIEDVGGDATLAEPTSTLITIVDDDVPSFADFSDAQGLSLNGAAGISGTVLRLTPDTGGQRGSAYFDQALEVSEDLSFETQFAFRVYGNRGTNGADGFTFLIQNSAAGLAALGGAGGGLGYSGIGQSLAVEFDTYQGLFDLNNNHISVLAGGSVSAAVQSQASPLDLNDGSVRYAWIDYDGAMDTISVYLSDTSSKPGQATLTAPVDLAGLVGSQAYLGFTGATGGVFNTHDVLSWQFSSEVPPPPSGPGEIRLQNSVLSVNEGAGTITVDVLRENGSDGEVTIDYHTIDGTALAGQDYQAQSGTLSFVDGQTLASVVIPILEDEDAESNESFNIAIDNPGGGALLLAPRTATITISDNDGGAEFPDFSDFAGTSDLALNGSAAIVDDRLQLTGDVGSQQGSAYFLQEFAVDADRSFTTQFQFQISGSLGSNGADGITFVIQNSAAGLAALGGKGGGLGYSGIDQSLAVEFDTYEGSSDLNNNHLSVLVNGSIATAIQTQSPSFDINGAGVVSVWVDYNGAADELAVYVSNLATKPAQPLIIENVDLFDLVGNQAYLGFTGGTGGKYNRQEFLNWHFNDHTPPPVDPGNVVAIQVAAGLLQPTSIKWTPDGQLMLIAEKGGVVRVVKNGQLLATPFIDISEMVNQAGDRGLLDIEVHPDFPNQPYVYLLYTYDPPEAFDYPNDQFAKPDGSGNRAGRLVRVEADANNNFESAVAGSEVLLLGSNSTWDNFNGFVDSTVDLNEPPAGILPDGANLQDFIASDSLSHTVGALEFGLDGSLFVSIGDGTSYNQMDPRAVRVQDVDNLSGKVLRIDPLTGQGLVDNPFYNGNPQANQSKVYQYGLRNPFRIALDSLTGQIYIGDVGWTRWEEINAGQPGDNFGWPYYEGGSGESIRTTGYRDLPEAQDFYSSGLPVVASLYALDHAQAGINAIVMGDVYRGSAYQADYQGDLFFNDLGQGIVRRLRLDANGDLAGIKTFTTGANVVVSIQTGPDGLLYFADFDDGVVGRWEISSPLHLG